MLPKPTNKLTTMANTLLLHDFITNHHFQSFKIVGEKSRTIIKFSLRDVLYHQPRITAVFKMLNRNQSKPIAKSFLGQVMAISFEE
mgnify:CR=1 FL=1